MDESLCIENERAKARRARRDESILLLPQEMGHIWQYLAWRVAKWQAGAKMERDDAPALVHTCLRAYALKLAEYQELTKATAATLALEDQDPVVLLDTTSN
ncbi:hypothetical protein DFH06DRAFT_1316429 [Mycena polygramma]|nr:hypothetical protein DFH06DRAFT_1316429 [Mycena polygramma]